MQIPIYQVDAFAGKPFEGNPAAVCPLEQWRSDELLQRIAAENNLSETAFFVGSDDGYELRWFTPTTEVDLCGHATLASAYVLVTQLGASSPIMFTTKSGPLSVSWDGRLLEMDFPALPLEQAALPSEISEALGLRAEPDETLRSASGTYVLVLSDEPLVRDLDPDLGRLERVGVDLVVTAASDSFDFVSRYFAPSYGVPEDPVTGSVHCSLAPYWSKRLGKRRLRAYQASKRGGELECEPAGDRVKLRGACRLYMRGQIDA